MNFRQVKKKIRTILNVKQITKAMQMVSSVKMKKAQETALEGRLYRETLDMIMHRVVSKTQKSVLPIKLNQDKSSLSRGSNLYIFISSNKGLCGSFNLNLFKKALHEVDAQKDRFITLGRKGAEFLLKMRAFVVADFSHQQPFIDNVSAVFDLAYEKFIKGECKSVCLFYNRFISTFQHQPTKKMLLPFDVSEFEKTHQEDAKESDLMQNTYLIEPSPDEVFKSLIIDFLQDKIRGAIQESEAAEHSSRMIAMKNATDSAGDLIYNLTLLRNKLRQTSITNELLEITTAKESTAVIN